MLNGNPRLDGGAGWPIIKYFWFSALALTLLSLFYFWLTFDFGLVAFHGSVNLLNAGLVEDKQALTSFDLNMPALEDYSIFDISRDDEDDGSVADMNNLDTTIQVSPIPTTRIHKDHPLDHVIRDLQLIFLF
ncbi:hypothetical protein Tco_1251801 [Tanacetum coccineum]